MSCMLQSDGEAKHATKANRVADLGHRKVESNTRISYLKIRRQSTDWKFVA
jgi:hypothetical protein